jgi:CO/xanthine dehydrogenase Mo-binding subunit
VNAPAPLPASLKANPRLGQWLTIGADGSVTVRSGKVELGQGIRTALAQIVAHELDVNIERVRMVSADTAFSPNEGVTAGSLSITDSGGALRQVCAQARRIYLRQAALRLGLKPQQEAQLRVIDGRMGVPGDTAVVSYWELADPALLDRDATDLVEPRASPPKQAPRLDLPAKVLGRPSYLHDQHWPGLLYGVVVQPPSPSARLLRADVLSARAWPGVVAVVQQGSFLGLVAQTEYQALQARARLASDAQWQEFESLPDMHTLADHLRQGPVETTTVGSKTATAAPAAVAQHAASYQRPFLAHASIAPSCAVATFTPEQATQLEVWTHSQGVFNLRADLATLLGLPAQAVRVRHADGAGCYGHNGADDVAADAALLARAIPGRPVRVQWSREDELTCAPVGAAMVADLQAELDAQGHVVQWRHQVWSTGHSMRPGRSPVPVLRAASLMDPPFESQVAINMPMAVGGGAERNAVPLYDFAAHEVISHRQLRMPIRTSSLRSLGAHLNVFAAESFMDELAEQAGCDPLSFRLRHLQDERARLVLERVARWSAWQPTALAEGQGMGLGLARYKNTGAWCAAVAQVDAGASLRVKRLWLVVDAGRIINQDGARNQIEGGAIQTVSWVTKEQVCFDRTRITSGSWESYPILRFTEVPQVEVDLIDRPDQPSLGVGEATHGPVAAAIANAVYVALGVRMRTMPIHAETIARAALAA